MILRDYQEECLAAFARAVPRGHSSAVAVMPTGSGKSLTFATQMMRHPGRSLVLTHTDELAEQAERTLRAVAPDESIGVVKADRDEIGARLIVASRQTLASAARLERLGRVGLLVIDEAHLATAGNTYGRIRDALAPTFTAGYTATLHREDGADLTRLWAEVAYRRDILWMIERGYLVDVRGEAVYADSLDLRKVKQSGGDYDPVELAAALSGALMPELVARTYAEKAGARKGLLFAPTVESSYEFAEALVAIGVPAEVVHGAMAKSERRAVLRRLRSGATQVVCNCAVLTTGFDEPSVSCVAMVRPTRSRVLYQQCVGRGMRLSEGKADCLLLDFAGASRDNDLRSLVDLSEKPGLVVKEGRTLLEAGLDVEPGGVAEVKARWAGAVKARKFDPLMRASRRTWQRTPGTDTRFLPAGDVYVTILESREPGLWDVCWVGKHGGGQGRSKHTELSLDMAMDWGEQLADELGKGTAIFTTKGKAWRRSKDITPGQRRVAAELGITIEPGMRKGDVSDMVDFVRAGRRVDPVIERYREFLDSDL